MYIKRKDSNILSVWEDTQENRLKALSWGYEIYNGAVEQNGGGEWYVKGTVPPAVFETYADKRKKEYPPVEEQLDMIYWDGVNNTAEWIKAISAIKAKYPKE